MENLDFFNIKLESVITSEVLYDINTVFALTRVTRSLNELNHHLEKINNKSIIFGRSGSHLWVSYPNGNRILIVTSS